MRIEIDPWAPHGPELLETVELLRGGGVLAIPTDSGYAMACDLDAWKAIDRMYDLKQSPRSHPLSLLFAEVDDIGRFSGPISTLAYRTLKRVLPGPYTFILAAGTEIPKRMHKKRRTIGVRVPDAAIPRALARFLGRPLVTTSLRLQNDGEERFVVDPVDIELVMGDRLDAVIDGGVGLEDPTTVVDLCSHPFELLRSGQGDIDAL